MGSGMGPGAHRCEEEDEGGRKAEGGEIGEQVEEGSCAGGEVAR